MSEASVELNREVPVVRIPSGDTITLPAGTAVVVTQALGDSFTVVIPSQPGLYRIAGEDADALGREKVAPAAKPEGQTLEDSVWAALKN